MKIDYFKNGTGIYTDPYHKMGTDSLLLANFCTLKPNSTVCDLGTGCGILLLALYDKGLRNYGVGLDIDKTAIKLFEQSILLNKISNFQGICQNFEQYKPKNQFSIVICNPPYFSEGAFSPVRSRAHARHEQKTSIQNVSQTASRLLKDKGDFFVCWRAERLVDLFCALRACQLEPKKMQMVSSKKGKTPYLVLVQAKKFAGDGLITLPNHIIQNS